VGLLWDVQLILKVAEEHFQAMALLLMD